MNTERFNEYLLIKGFTKSSATKFCNTVQLFEHWTKEQNIEIETVSYNDIVAYVNYCKAQGNKQRSVQIKINVLKHFYNHLQYDELIEENPCTNVEIKGVKRKTLYVNLTAEELETIYKSYQTQIKYAGKKIPPQGKNELARKRNKVILGLMIYQGMRSEELERLTIQDIKAREGKIHIAGSRRTNERTLKLETFQVFDLMDYINTTRKELLQIRKENPQENNQQLFLSVNGGRTFNNTMQKLVKKIQSENSKLKDIKQIRTSVITNWLKVYNLRKVQYMAGHRYVSSTENYYGNNMEELQDEIKKYHPIG